MSALETGARHVSQGKQNTRLKRPLTGILLRTDFKSVEIESSSPVWVREANRFNRWDQVGKDEGSFL